ncbi:hypothetical protein H2199_003747 [Coniosporium tulheliwenetii]|uniref:Uncharacterized protein n=1 Tax=Coniosporium tulheliwenetii TaxID=3383036 RepID=A0ACC2ZAK3_9PEZI|nr:hypothetical protein H2199_003747 [Cladosporium sp. JES 115]
MFAQPPRSHPEPDHFHRSSFNNTAGAFNDGSTVDAIPSEATAASSICSGQSPRLVDLLLPGTDLNATPPEYLDFRSQYPDSFYEPAFMPQVQEAVEEDDDVEEIVRQPPINPDHEAWVMRLPSPAPSSSSSSSDESVLFPRADSWMAFCREPQFTAGSPEMLTLSFDRETCGILSILDGPTENPWRTLVWPLARDSPVLYHAIALMTSFHTSRCNPRLRIEGIDHMRNSIQALATGIQNMRVEIAMATTLALAFSESWDQHISTGINHIKGAKILINKALTQHKHTPFFGEALTRMKFLCNTWIYMDVISRLISADDDVSNDFESVSSVLTEPFGMDSQLDPLMGSASTLFPVIGRVANLAMELKLRLESWQPPDFFEDPEDPTTEVQYSIQNAEAYRWATLLYLHQAVPEIPSLSSANLAKKVLVLLATVPMRSRAVVVQTFPSPPPGARP